MKNIIVFAGSNSKNSINKELVTYASNLITEANVTIFDINDYGLPIYGIDLENSHGIPDNAYKFLEAIKKSDGILLSLAEHNGAYTTAFKNLFDWMSRIEGKTFYGKPMLLMATAPGGRGGASVLEIAKNRFPYHDADIVDTFSLPFFGKNFEEGKIVDKELDEKLKLSIEKFEKAVSQDNYSKEVA